MEKNADSILKALIEVSHIEFQLYDFSNRHLICTSGVAEKILGYSKAEFSDLSTNFFEKLIHVEDAPKVYENIERLLRSKHGEIVEMTARYKKSDNTYIWIYTRKMVTEKDADNNPSTIITVAEDVTQMIIIQEQLKEKVQQLKLISYKNSHELRSPVSSILGLLDLIEEEHIASAHNLEILSYLKESIMKLDLIVREINEAAG